MIRRVILVITALACTISASKHARQAAERRQARDSLLAAEVVQALKTPISPSRIIYERPADLSYDSLRVKRPDLM